MLGPHHLSAAWTALTRDRRIAIHVAAAATIIVLVSLAALPTRADGPDHETEWRMIGHDIRNTRSQSDEYAHQPAQRLASRPNGC